jgi:hypothetical protein
MRTIIAVSVLALVATACAATATAQEQPSAPAPQVVTLFELALRDGSRLYGAVVSETADEVVFRTHAGTVVTVKRGDIQTLRQTSGVLIGEEFARADPNTTRLFFGPTGRSLERGKTYLGMYEFIMPFVQVGITDRISIGGGTPLMFGGGESGRPFWITPKVQVIRGSRTQVSVGAFHGFANADDYAGVAYVVGTHGTAASSFTIGAGLGYAGEGGRAAVVMAGGERQFRRNMKLITENYIWTGGNGVVTGGVRFFGERLSADVALAVPIADFFFIAPLVNFVYLF